MALPILMVCLLLAGRASAEEVSAAVVENRRCLNCHGQSRMATLPLAEQLAMVAPPTTQPLPEKYQRVRPGLHVTPDSLAGVHANLACVSCHADAKSLPHAAVLNQPDCASCHAPAGTGYLQGAHAAAVARGDANAPTCVSCHGGHDVKPKRDRASRTYPLNIVKICGDCHKTHENGNGKDNAQNVAKYLGSVHGRAVSGGGLAVAATCADCHGSHRVLPSKDPKSAVFRSHVANTCGNCHVGLSETFEASIHGQEMAKGNAKAPVCSDCHTAHAITRTDTPAFKLDIVNECGTCHDKPIPGSPSGLTLYQSYRNSYHGQVMALGFARAARCSDCHGSHDVQRVEDPASSLSEANRIDTCRKCHEGASPKFASFQAHADPTNVQRSPVLFGVRWYFILMMSGAFGFFGLHSILWLVRSWIERARNGPGPNFHHSTNRIRRFTLVDRVNHAFVIVSFFGLTLTGLPLLYADQGWGRTLAKLLGGPNSAGLLHRFFAIMLLANFAVHFVGLARRFQKMGVRQMLFGPTTMLPRWKDITDCLGMWRWFFAGGSKPKFDRWTYWEKFDYVAEVGGSLIIAVSGLLLWFPVFFSHFVPGWMFNVAQFVHGYEALLAIGFIFTIHFFNAHLRLEKFPVDDVMFTGQLPEEELKHERGEEYARLVATGEIEKLRVAPSPVWHRRLAVAAGMIAMAIGTTLVVLIVLAGLGVL